MLSLSRTSAIAMRALTQEVTGHAKQVAFAGVVALTRAAKAKQKDVRLEMVKVLDRPTPRTLNSVKITPATKASPRSSVWLVDESPKGTAPAKYLRPQIEGGQRAPKRFEKALQRSGILYPGEWVIPAAGAKRNAYGNVTAGTYTRVLSQLRANVLDPLQNRTNSARSRKSRSKSAYFLMRTGKARGIWERRGKSAAPLFLFVRKPPTYKKRFDFYATAAKDFDRRFIAEFDGALRFAQRTAR